MKVTVIKVTADGEQLSVEWPVPQRFIDDHQKGRERGGAHIRHSLAVAFDLIDARLLEMNQRIMAQNYLISKLSPEARFAVNNVMDVLHGKADGPAVEAILKEREAEQKAAQARAEAEQHTQETLLEKIQRESVQRVQSQQEEAPAPASQAPRLRPSRKKDSSAAEVDPTIPGGH